MPDDNLSRAECFTILANIEDHPGFLPKARELAGAFLAGADYGADRHYAPFEYSPEAFDQRMDEIYDGLAAGMDTPHWLDSGEYSDRAVVEMLRQKAPFNLVDGAWLQNILSTGPCNEVQASLFAIWVDEAGNGRTELNHCNVYETLLRSVDVYLPPITSAAFAEAGFLPSAFDDPVFQMSVGLFPQELLPELLGMTLYLEWESTPTLASTVRMLDRRGMDSHFYRLHVAIDNIASGHGALAKKAVKLHLEEVRERGGDAARQSAWKRIWNGYVTWATLGSFGRDLRRHLQLLDGKLPGESRRYAEQQMLDMIARKAPVARKSHGRARLGGRRLNDLFDDPKALLTALLDGPEGWMDRHRPRDSRFVRELITFTGPMFKVFTEQEVEVILGWLESLGDGPTSPEPPADVGHEMRRVLSDHAAAGGRQPRHKAFKLPREDGTERSVAAWFDEAPEEMMGALARSSWITPGSVTDSTFFTEVLGPEGMMAGVLPPEDEDVIRRWVDAGCPPPKAGMRSAPLAAEPADERFATRRLTIGHGSVH